MIKRSKSLLQMQILRPSQSTASDWFLTSPMTKLCSFGILKPACSLFTRPIRLLRDVELKNESDDEASLSWTKWISINLNAAQYSITSTSTVNNVNNIFCLRKRWFLIMIQNTPDPVSFDADYRFSYVWEVKVKNVASATMRNESTNNTKHLMNSFQANLCCF